MHWLDLGTGFRADGASEFPIRLLSEEEASTDPSCCYREEWLQLDRDRAYNLRGYAKRLPGLCWVCLERMPRCVLVQIPVSFSRQLDDLLECFFQPETFKLLVKMFRRLVKSLEDVSVLSLVGGETRDLILEPRVDESDGSMDEVAHDIVEFRVDLPLEFFPGEVRVSLFGSETDEGVTPVFRVFEFKRLVYPNADLSALGESLAFELDVFCAGYFPRQVVSFVAS